MSVNKTAEKLTELAKQVESGNVVVSEMLPTPSTPIQWSVLPDGFTLSYLYHPGVLVLTLSDLATDDDVEACAELVGSMAKRLNSEATG